MPTYYPEVNSNLIITQLPYESEIDFGNVIQDVDSGMRWAYPLRGAGLPGYPTGPLSKFALNYPQITDAEVNALYAFFKSCQGSYATFRFLDPGGNLLKASETFTNAAWSYDFSITSGQSDPFRGTRGSNVGAGYMQSVVGPSDGGMVGMVMCASMWVRAFSGTVNVSLGFVDETTSTQYLVSAAVSTGWRRLSITLVLPTSNQFNFYFSTSGLANIFGAQVSPMKGEGAYMETPGNYGYHANCRFDVDSFAVKSGGPNQNQLALPVAEFWVS